MTEDEGYWLDDPALVIKAALAWVPRGYLYHGISEMVDSLAEGVPDIEDEDEFPIYDVMKSLDILFRAATTGACFHAKVEHEAPPLKEEDLKKFQEMLGLGDQDNNEEEK